MTVFQVIDSCYCKHSSLSSSTLLIGGHIEKHAVTDKVCSSASLTNFKLQSSVKERLEQVVSDTSLCVSIKALDQQL